ncbi:MAG: RND transporter, partial [Chloroflexota bacterium]
MTVTVSLLVDSRTNVVLVPSAAITTKGGQTSVNVVSADNTTATRAIQTGITDRQNTEVISGISEGEKVMVTKTTPSASATSTATRPTTTPIGIPGIGGMGGGAFGR